MTTTPGEANIRVTDVDQVFPAAVERAPGRDSTSGPGDVAPQVNAALRDVLGWRPRIQDPKAFVDALGATFRLVNVEGHVEATYVPRGYAVQADLGAVTGGQASLYRRATVVRQEMLRIVDGLTPLRTEADAEDMEAYRSMVRSAVNRLVDELGAAGGPRVEMVDSYLEGLTGVRITDAAEFTPDSISGQLGALRDRFGLIDNNVNTIEEEGVRTSFWTLADMVVDLRRTWANQRTLFTSTGGGFIGTDLIKISRLMEAAADQVDEVELALDSVLISRAERRTIYVNNDTGLTLDGLLTWVKSFLSDEGRRIAEESGRDGIVSALTPTAVELSLQFEKVMAKVLGPDPDPVTGCCHLLPLSCTSDFPPGMSAARNRVAMTGLCRLLHQLALQLSGIGRFAPGIPIDLTISRLGERDDVVAVRLRMFNVQTRSMVGFIPSTLAVPQDGRLQPADVDSLYRPLQGSSTFDSESISALYRLEQIEDALPADVANRLKAAAGLGGVTFPAEDVPFALIDGERGRVINAPLPRHWPTLQPVTRGTATPAKEADKYDDISTGGVIWSIPEKSLPGAVLHDATPPVGGTGSPPLGGSGSGPTGTVTVPAWLQALIDAILGHGTKLAALATQQDKVANLADEIATARATIDDPKSTAAQRRTATSQLKTKEPELRKERKALDTATREAQTATDDKDKAWDNVPADALVQLRGQPGEAFFTTMLNNRKKG